MICVPLAEPNADQARRTMLTAAARADLVELRLDQFDELPAADDLARFLHDRPCPVIVTARPASEGGRHDWHDDARLKLLQAAIELGADYVDVELPPAEGAPKQDDRYLLMRDFVDCVTSGGAPKTACADNIKSLAMVFGAIDSADSGKKTPIAP